MPKTAPKADAADLSGLSREQLEARVKQLTDELAAANAESEKFRQQWADLKLRDEALGVEALTADQQKLEEKYVDSVKDLYQTVMKHREALALLQKLLETTDQLMQEAPKYDPKLLGPSTRKRHAVPGITSRGTAARRSRSPARWRMGKWPTRTRTSTR